MSVVQTATINGLRMAYRIDGGATAPAVLLHHPLATDHTFWDETTAGLTDRYRVVRFDARGHGATEAAAAPYTFATLTGDAIGLMDHLGIARAGFVGLSMGGMIAQFLGARFPDRVTALVIAASSSRVAPELRPLWRDRVVAARRDGMRSQVEPALGRWLSEANRRDRPELVARCRRLIEATSLDGYAGWCGAIETLETSVLLPTIQVPTLVVAGALDPATPPAASEVICNGIPGARMAVVPSTSHMIAIEDPAAFLATIRPFLEAHG
jgi:3-oxoadipate enol-lactonase